MIMLSHPYSVCPFFLIGILLAWVASSGTRTYFAPCKNERDLLQEFLGFSSNSNQVLRVWITILTSKANSLDRKPNGFSTDSVQAACTVIERIREIISTSLARGRVLSHLWVAGSVVSSQHAEFLGHAALLRSAALLAHVMWFLLPLLILCQVTRSFKKIKKKQSSRQQLTMARQNQS